ncbi:Uncharacterised protein [Klebsiella pneumoniae]|uniref:Uncharacterized protein n=1 Tax=Klebsiella pneumoniae TaxID=573 RepID=A0A378FSK2_KLEPN|nr:Uncharacterised protein [Klebsiella pneumoniae]
MRNVIAAVMASTLALSAYSQPLKSLPALTGSPETTGDSAVAKAICLTA